MAAARDLSSFSQLFIRGKAGSEGLIVVFPGLAGRSLTTDGAVLGWFALEFPSCDVLALTYGGFIRLSMVSPEWLALQFIAAIDEACAATTYKDIRFLAHSMGAAMARKALIGGWGEQNPDVPFEPGFEVPQLARTWPAKVSRIISVAGYARGGSPIRGRIS